MLHLKLHIFYVTINNKGKFQENNCYSKTCDLSPYCRIFQEKLDSNSDFRYVICNHCMSAKIS